MLKLIVLTKAESDLDGIFIYRNFYSFNLVKNISKKFKSSFNNLKLYPKFGKICFENNNFRELIC